MFEPFTVAHRHPFGRYVFVTASVHGLLTGVGFAIGFYTTAGPLTGRGAVRLGLAVATGLAIGHLWTACSPVGDDLEPNRQAPSHSDQLRETAEASIRPGWIGPIRALGTLAGIGATTWPYTLDGVLFGIRGAIGLVVLIGLTLLFGAGATIGSLLEESEFVLGAQTITAGIAVVGVVWLLP
ncbi:hypothetical protein C487_19468 [Natrinema pallidum DSM 3751]|uniref:Uncharacterized protein n=2 Tax=Natrinema pallidum TaxID=69527 RepID=L9YER4_9EURY|nr:hypothetical protein C487_19468 [Natrinema pallidum DSM 3751]